MKRNDAGKEENTKYKVAMNHEEQYSIWPDYKSIPPGWTYSGVTGLKAECLTHIEEVWTDMRPLSLRKKMAELAKNPPPSTPATDNGKREKSLVDRLSEGEHEVEISLRPDTTAKLFKEAVDRGYVHIKFTQTKGGTELGINLDEKASDFSGADFENGKGVAHLEGDITLNGVKVKCVADIELGIFSGKGGLVKLQDTMPDPRGIGTNAA